MIYSTCHCHATGILYLDQFVGDTVHDGRDTARPDVGLDIITDRQGFNRHSAIWCCNHSAGHETMRPFVFVRFFLESSLAGHAQPAVVIAPFKARAQQAR